MSKELIYAIDFGTSNSLLAAAQLKTALPPVELDPQNKDSTVLRSLMYFPKSGEPSFGQTAISNYTLESGEGRFIRSIKKFLPTESFKGTQINSKFYKIEELISRFLKEIKSRADRHFQQDVKAVVLGRPALFSEDEAKDRLAQDRLEAAAKIAGFTQIEFFPEPLAAAYDYRNQLRKEKLVLVADLGGGTSDFTVIRLRPDDYSKDDVLSIGGLSIAGDMLDGCLMAHKIAPHFGSEISYQLPLSSNILKMPPSLKYNLMSPAEITLMSRSDVMNFLTEVKKCTFNEDDKEKLDQLFSLISHNLGFSIFEEIEKTKREICQHDLAQFSYDRDEIQVHESFNKEEFQRFTEDKIQAILNSLDDVIAQAGVKHSQIDLICCTGGTSRVPAIVDGLASRFGKEKIQSFKSFHSVIGGLAERAARL